MNSQEAFSLLTAGRLAVRAISGAGWALVLDFPPQLREHSAKSTRR